MRRTKRIILLSLVLIAAYVSINCTKIHTDDFNRVLGKEWNVVSIFGTELNAADLENGLPRIIFHENSDLSGSTGCNTFYGNYKLEGSNINLDPGSMTKMMCDVNTEMEFLDALEKVNSWKYDGDNFELLNDEKPVMILVSGIK